VRERRFADPLNEGCVDGPDGFPGYGGHLAAALGQAHRHPTPTLGFWVAIEVAPEDEGVHQLSTNCPAACFDMPSEAMISDSGDPFLEMAPIT
jgi:hypothetical protein